MSASGVYLLEVYLAYPPPRMDLGPGIPPVDRITERHLSKIPSRNFVGGGKYDVKRSKFIHCISKVSFHIITVATVVAERLCFHKHLSFCPRAEVYTPRQTPPGHTHPRTPPWTHPPRRPLQRTVRILLECILVLLIKSVFFSVNVMIKFM